MIRNVTKNRRATGAVPSNSNFVGSRYLEKQDKRAAEVNHGTDLQNKACWNLHHPHIGAATSGHHRPRLSVHHMYTESAVLYVFHPSAAGPHCIGARKMEREVQAEANTSPRVDFVC